MRFTSTLFAVLPALSLLTPALAFYSKPEGNAFTAIVEKYNQQSRGRTNYKPCANYSTRDPKLCTCEGDTVEPVNWYYAKQIGRRDLDEAEHELAKRTFSFGGRGCGDWPKQECVCPDAPNTFLTFKRNKPVCECPGKNQKFDSDKDQCDCKPGFEAKRKNGNYLECKPPKPPTPSGYPVRQYRRTFNQAVAERRDGLETRNLETLLGCGATERACEAKGSWTCTNIMTSLQTCGGCAEEAVDCAALPGVDTVSCVAGACVANTCARGFELVGAECVAKSTSSLFNVQA